MVWSTDLYSSHFGVCGRLETPMKRLDHVQRKARDSHDDGDLVHKPARQDKRQVCSISIL